MKQLQPELWAAGTFAPARLYHAIWFVITLGLFFGSQVSLLGCTSLPLRALAIGVAGLMLMQLGLLAHEVGHGAVTRSLLLRNLLGHLSNTVLVGLSFSYWLHAHTVHHNHPNQEGLDPDLESVGYALYEGAARRPGGLTRILGRFQPLSVLLGCLIWGFAIRLAGASYVVRHLGRRTAADVVGLALHLLFWLGGPLLFLPWTTVLLNYVLSTVLSGIYMGAILIVPHVGAGTQATGESLPFFERQVRFSRNYGTSFVSSVLCGGLNLQIEHHLLPYVPHIRLRRARAIIRAHCQRLGLPYQQVSYQQAWREVLTHLARMSFLVKAQGESLQLRQLEGLEELE